MPAGINRVHGSLVNPKNFAGVAVQDFTLTFWTGDIAALAADAGNANSGLDQAFRTAVGTVASVSRVGTVTSNTLRFAVESLGFEGDNSGEGFLGTGPDNADGGVTTTAAALQAAIQALGTTGSNWTNALHLTSATVVKFVY